MIFQSFCLVLPKIILKTGTRGADVDGPMVFVFLWDDDDGPMICTYIRSTIG